jgi:integrase
MAEGLADGAWQFGVLVGGLGVDVMFRWFRRSRVTLGEFFDECFVPLWIQGQSLAPRTLEAYRESIDRWVRLTGDPPLPAVDDFVAAAFVHDLSTQSGRKAEIMAKATIRKHIQHVQLVLDFAGPKTRQRPDAQQLLRRPIFLKKPRADYHPPDGDFTLDEIHKLYRACSVMTRPGHLSPVTPCDWWRVLLVVAYYSGLRIGALMLLEYKMINREWLRVPAGISKGRKGIRQYLSSEARREIERIRTERQTIFDWRNWPRNKVSLHEHRRKLLVAAGLPEGRQFGFHGLRRAHLTVLNLEAAQIGARAAQRSAGHASVATTMGSYINAAVSERLVAEAIERMPSPIPPELS